VSDAGQFKRAAITGFVLGAVVAFVVLMVLVAVLSSLSGPAVLAILFTSLIVGGGLGGFIAAFLAVDRTAD
jgi:hypothetical protein